MEWNVELMSETKTHVISGASTLNLDLVHVAEFLWFKSFMQSKFFFFSFPFFFFFFVIFFVFHLTYLYVFFPHSLFSFCIFSPLIKLLSCYYHIFVFIHNLFLSFINFSCVLSQFVLIFFMFFSLFPRFSFFLCISSFIPLFFSF